MIKVAIIDDTQEYVDQINNLVSNILEEEAAEAHVDTYKSAVELESKIEMGRNCYYDVYLMDIEMPEMNGLELAQFIRGRYPEPYFIFITSHEQYSIDAFEVRTFNYIMKDRLDKKFVPVFRKLVQHLAERKDPYYLIDTKELYQKVYYKDIYYIYVEKKYTYFHTPVPAESKVSKIEMKIPSVRESLKNVYAKISDSQMFIHVDQNCVVNLMHVMKVQRKEHKVVLRDGTVLDINESRFKAFDAAIVAYSEARR